MDDYELIKNISGSYADFVESVTRWMNRDVNIRNRILNYIHDNPNASASEVIGVLWDCLGICEPLELVDEEH